MINTEIFYLLRLQRTPGIGIVNAKKLIQHCGSAEAIFKEKRSHLLKINGIGKVLIDSLLNESAVKSVEKEAVFMEKSNTAVFSYFDVDYPDKLKHCGDAPLVIFQKGKINLKNKKILSVVGTRQMTNYGKGFLENFVEEIKSYNPILVSGLAYGVDIFTHKTALKNDLQTIAVLAHGLDTIYPKSHFRTANEMLENGGLISEFWSNTNPDRENFVKRNRIVAGISEATLVIESAEKGGSLITADIANSYNRDVLAVPGRSTDFYSQGCNQLIKQNKAALVCSAQDLAEFLNWDLDQKEPKTVQQQIFIEIDEQERPIIEILQANGKMPLDEIALHCKMPIQKVAPLLFGLEMKGAVQTLPGKFFIAI